MLNICWLLHDLMLVIRHLLVFFSITSSYIPTSYLLTCDLKQIWYLHSRNHGPGSNLSVDCLVCMVSVSYAGFYPTSSVPVTSPLQNISDVGRFRAGSFGPRAHKTAPGAATTQQLRGKQMPITTDKSPRSVSERQHSQSELHVPVHRAPRR